MHHVAHLGTAAVWATSCAECLIQQYILSLADHMFFIDDEMKTQASKHAVDAPVHARWSTSATEAYSKYKRTALPSQLFRKPQTSICSACHSKARHSEAYFNSSSDVNNIYWLRGPRSIISAMTVRAQGTVAVAALLLVATASGTPSWTGPSPSSL